MNDYPWEFALIPGLVLLVWLAALTLALIDVWLPEVLPPRLTDDGPPPAREPDPSRPGQGAGKGRKPQAARREVLVNRLWSSGSLWRAR